MFSKDIYHSGVVISGESWFPATDLVGTTWDASNPSRGCFEAAGGGSAALTGTAISGGVTEAEIQDGGETIIITLTDDTWVATVGDDNAITDAIIAGIDSDGAEAAGWDAVVKANMVFGDVVRTSATVVTVTLAAEATYVITADETITVTIPAAALTADTEIVATPTFDITNASAGGSIVVLRRRILEVA